MLGQIFFRLDGVHLGGVKCGHCVTQCGGGGEDIGGLCGEFVLAVLPARTTVGLLLLRRCGGFSSLVAMCFDVEHFVVTVYLKRRSGVVCRPSVGILFILKYLYVLLILSVDLC